jgi:hypothetical protein
MEKNIIITKRFRNNTFSIYQYLIKEHSTKTAFLFLHKLQERIELIAAQPSIGKPSAKMKDIRSITLTPHNRIYYRSKKDSIEILCLFDMRKKPDKNRYK